MHHIFLFTQYYTYTTSSINITYHVQQAIISTLSSKHNVLRDCILPRIVVIYSRWFVKTALSNLKLMSQLAVHLVSCESSRCKFISLRWLNLGFVHRVFLFFFLERYFSSTRSDIRVVNHIIYIYFLEMSI